MNGFRDWAGRLAMRRDLWLSRDEWADLPPGGRITILCLAGWCIFVCAAALVAIGMTRMAASAGSSPAALVSQVAPKSRPAGADDLILERPLFVRSRQAAVVVVPQRPPPPPPPRVANDSSIMLSGVFMNGSMAKAFVKTSQNPAGSWLAQDEVMGDWRLVAVRPGEVELESSSGRIVLPFSNGAGGK